MKNIMVFCLMILILSACNYNDDVRFNIDTVTYKPIDFAQKKLDTIINLHVNQDTSLANRILGIWAIVGQENASFDIQSNKIYYPEYSKSYKYQIAHNTLAVKYDDYCDSFLVEIKGRDTLILITEDERQIYYRFKK